MKFFQKLNQGIKRVCAAVLFTAHVLVGPVLIGATIAFGWAGFVWGCLYATWISAFNMIFFGYVEA